ncbi:phage baseplate assembly protein V [Stagnimonas aquatica]|uniref:Phage baseplate assembly protein V n=1 Tax=Stagnimonas aquatica TaxID=2689987 RepID=A0A3N0V7H4_9GAMM|nr:phage baseplate assembly protein V [Stagnimonas aquatica]ROH88669.1 phage baseplate assembly protein V [Stagnimonas aquatica]
MRPADLLRVLAPIQRRIRALAARTTVARAADAGASQRVQITVLAGERLDDVVRVQNFGLSANPPAGSTALLISIGGSRTHCVVIGADHESRPRDLAPGESQHYNQWGDCVYLQENGEALIKARAKVICDAPLTHVLGDAEIDGNLLVRGDITGLGNIAVAGTGYVEGGLESATSITDPAGTMAEMRSVFNSHTQPVSGGVAQAPAVPMS